MTHSRLFCHNSYIPTIALLPTGSTQTIALLPTGSRPLPNPGSISLPTLSSTLSPSWEPCLSLVTATSHACSQDAFPWVFSLHSPVLEEGCRPQPGELLCGRGPEPHPSSGEEQASSSVFICPPNSSQGSPTGTQSLLACPTLKAQGSGQGQQVGCKQEGEGERSPVQRWRLKSGSGT